MIILPANTLSTGGFEVANSVRFNKADAPALKRNSMGTATNTKKWTLSLWLKRSTTAQAMIASFDGAAAYYHFKSTGELEVQDVPGSTINYRLTTNAVYRDLSAWMHIVVAYDSTQGTDSNRLKLYVNGEQPSLGTATYPSSDFVGEVNSTGSHKYGSYDDSTDYAFDGYFAEVVFIDGTQYAASDFGEFDEDSPQIWKPKDPSGLTFGTNGHYLDFEDSSNLGNDANSGTDFDANNLATTDSSTDSPTNNFATLNPLVTYPSTPPVHSEGNLQVVTVNADPGYFGSSSTIGVSQGKWYFEVKPTASTSGAPFLIGVSYDPAEAARLGTNAAAQYTASEYAYYGHNGNKFNNDSDSSYGNSYAVDDIVGVALDLDNHKIYFSKNGTFQNSGDPTTGSTGTGSAFNLTTGETYFPFLSDGGGAVCTYQCNFGSPPYAISSGNADDNGYGNFEYDVPTGYLALCTKNLGSDGG